MTLDDLQRPFRTLFQNIHAFSEPNKKITMKTDPYSQRQRCSAMTVVSGNIRFMRIFAGVLWRRGVKQQWDNRKCRFSEKVGRYVFGTLGNEANIIIKYCVVPRHLSSNPKIGGLHDLEWPWMTILRWFSLLRTANLRIYFAHLL